MGTAKLDCACGWTRNNPDVLSALELWLHESRHMPKEETFEKDVEKELTGRETEPWEIRLNNRSAARPALRVSIIYGGLTVRSVDGFIHNSLLEPS